MTFDDVSREVVKDFLQSVVLIDDQAYFGEEPLPNLLPQLVSPGPGDAQTAKSEERKTIDAERRSHKLNAKLMIEVFAERGLVCGVLKPQSPQTLAELMKQTLPAVRRADIVIIDWMLEGTIGNALETIRSIIDADEKDCVGLRLIAIYTGERDLSDIVKQLKKNLSNFDYINKDINSLSLTNGWARIAVYAKEDTKVKSSLKDRVFKIDQLPDELIKEYTETTKGLVPNVALASLAALRRYTHLLLEKMSAKLDASYLAHRVSIEHPDDAAELLVNIVGAELQSILDQAEVHKQVDINNIELWLKPREGTLPKLSGSVRATAWPGALYELVRKGHTDPVVKGKFDLSNKDKKSASQFSEATTNPDEECDFAILSTLRTRYGTPHPTLTLGQILHKQAEVSGKMEDEYWMCLQPPCDSVRINSTRPFPLLPMKKVSEAGSKDNPGNVFVLEHPDGKYTHLKTEYIPYKCQMVVFAADAAARQVIASKREDGTFCFTSDQNVCYNWIAQLKQDSAQHVANEYAGTISRVGRDISEWLRTYPK